MDMLERARAARPIVAEAALRTPLVPLAVERGPVEIWLKLENLQPTGSFKLRGLYHAVRRLPPDRLAAGLLTASAGNAAQGLAFAARRLGAACTVVVPEGAPPTKLDAIRRLGGRIVSAPFDDWWQAFATRRWPGVDGAFVHPFDDLDVMAGNGTIALELLEDLPDLDAVVVPFGGGGLAIGVASVLRALRPSVRIIAAEAAHGAPLAASLATGRSVEVAYRPSLADGIVGKDLLPSIWARARTLIDRSVPVEEAEIERAIRLLAERNRVVAEGAAGAAVAAALRPGAVHGRVACIVSGGNIDLSRLAAILAAEPGPAGTAPSATSG